jgi:hypothetical protein
MRKLLPALVLLPALAHAQAFRVGSGLQLVPRSSEPSHNAANGTLWIDSTASNVLKYCNPASSCITLGSGGGGGTLASSYAAGASQSDSTFALDSTRLGLRIWDNATPIGSNLLSVASSSGTTLYLGVGVSSGVGVVNSTNGTIIRANGLDRLTLYPSDTTTLASGVANSGTNVGFVFNTTNTLSGTTLLASFRNNGTEKFAVADDGSLALQGTTTGTYSIGGTPTLASNLVTNGFVGPNYGGTSTNVPTVTWTAVAGSCGSDPCFKNSWVNHGTTYNDAAIHKDALGRVCLRGMIKSGTLSAAAFTLPTGYRPSGRDVDVVSFDNGGMSQIVITTAGDVKPSGGGNSFVGLDNVCFYAQQ